MAKERSDVDFFQFAFDILPGANTYQTPESKANAIYGLLQRCYMPFAELAMRQNIQVDVAALIRETAKLANLEHEVKSILVDAQIPADLPSTIDQRHLMGMVNPDKPNGQY